MFSTNCTMRILLTNPLNLFLIVGLVLSVGNSAWAAPPQQLQYNRDIKPILSNYCFACHGPEEEGRQAELRLDDRDNAVELGSLVPGDPAQSELIARILSDDADTVMPPPESKKSLSAEQKALLQKWVAQGAAYQKHWSFEPLQLPAVPDVTNPDQVRNPIDAFVLKSLEAQGYAPSPPADRATLIRRVSFDLTGLPPTLEELKQFQVMEDETWYEQMVDHYFAKPAYGERMTLAWMDAARYGDTSVFHADGPRDMWPWRDWCINAYNDNKPFDEFTVEQLAGDLIPDATVSQKIASGFNRNHGTTDEGGAIAEEYRVEYVVDRVQTTANVWMGLSMECAQCHSHKYDPISHKEYYGFYAFFNQTTDPGMQTRRGNQSPVVNVPNPELDPKIAAAQSQLAELKTQIAAYQATIEEPFQKWLESASAEAKAGNGPKAPEDMRLYFPLDETEGERVMVTGTDVAIPVDTTDSAETTPQPVENAGLKAESVTLNGTPAWQAGHDGNAIQLDGKTSITLAEAGNFDHDEAVSYGCWVHPQGSLNGAPLAKMNEGNAHRGWDLLLTNGTVAVHIIHSWADAAIKVTTKKKMPADKWTHLFATYDGSGKAAGVKIYFNGELQPLTVNNDSLAGKTTLAEVPLKIGGRHNSSPFTGLVDDVRIYGRALSESEVVQVAGADPIGPLLLIEAEQRTDEQLKQLKTHFTSAVDEQSIALAKQQTQSTARLDGLKKQIKTSMVMQEQTTPRETYLLMRGHYGSPDTSEVIKPNVPEVLPSLPESAPRNRLGLARWLVSDEHPLTARVTVNRYWTMLFGRGLVSTPMDFGSQGAWPTHPDLLDWLAADFRDHGWDVKRTLKQILMSATYRQSSRVRSDLAETDPENVWLARTSRLRLPGEMIRDTALSVSGLLNPKIGGPGVNTYQPPGLWNEVALTTNVYFKRDEGDKLYRKSMYIYWKRSAPHPGMLVFDAPTREKCIVERPRTNTPLQALYTLNDEQFVEAARMLAERLMRSEAESNDAKIRLAYQLLTAHQPSASAVSTLEDLYVTELEKFEQQPDTAKVLLSIGVAKRDESLPVAELAAWSVVANVLLNMDAAITKF